VGAARRKAMEEAGIAIELIGVPLCQRVTISYSDQTFNRWHLIVVAETASSVLDPKDRSEIAQAGLFDISPSHANTYLASWMNELHVAAMRFMRSLDVMDGI
jgi:DICT domain-containing protein